MEDETTHSKRFMGEVPLLIAPSKGRNKAKKKKRETKWNNHKEKTWVALQTKSTQSWGSKRRRSGAQGIPTTISVPTKGTPSTKKKTQR